MCAFAAAIPIAVLGFGVPLLLVITKVGQQLVDVGPGLLFTILPFALALLFIPGCSRGARALDPAAAGDQERMARHFQIELLKKSFAQRKE